MFRDEKVHVQSFEMLTSPAELEALMVEAISKRLNFIGIVSLDKGHNPVSVGAGWQKKKKESFLRPMNSPAIGAFHITTGNVNAYTNV